MVKFTEAIAKLIVELNDGTTVIAQLDITKYDTGKMQDTDELHLAFKSNSKFEPPITASVKYNQIKRVWFGSRWHSDLDYVATIIIESIDAHEQNYMSVFMADEQGFYSKIKLLDLSKLNKNFVPVPNTVLFETDDDIILQMEISAIERVFYRGVWWTDTALTQLMGGVK